MKKTIKTLAIIALAAIIGFSFTACGNGDDDDGGGGGGGKVPAALQGNWVFDDYDYYLVFDEDGWGTTQELANVTTKDYVVTSVNGTKVNWERKAGPPPSGSFDYAITGNTLTISNSTNSNTQGPSNGTYTKQGTSGTPDITYTVTATGIPDTTTITFTFSAAVTGLVANDIAITAGTGSATKGSLTGSGTSWSLGVTAGTAGTVNVSINKSGIESGSKPVTISKGSSGPSNITYTVTATGTPDTNALTFTFNATVTGLDANDITITPGTGSATKGSLTGSGTSWSLGVTAGTAGNVTVSISKAGIESASKPVTIAKAASGGSGVPAELQGNWRGDYDYLFINADGWADSETAFPTSITYRVTSISGNTVNWEHAQYGSPPSGSFDYAISGNTLTISNSTRSNTQGPSNGTYTRQGTSGPSDITYTVTPTGTPNTTALGFTFTDSVSVLSADDITIANGTGSVTKGNLTGSGTSWSLGIIVATAGDITVTINRTGIESASKQVTVSRGSSENIDYTVTASGAPDTTVFNFTFSDPVTELLRSDIYVGGDDNIVIKGSLSGSGTSWSLAVMAVSPGTIWVGINKTGIISTNKQVTVVKGSSPALTWTAVANNPLTDRVEAIVYGNGKFVAGSTDKIAYSDNGVAWTEATTNNIFRNSRIMAIAYGDEKFIAGGMQGKMATSSDGITWTAVANSTFGTSGAIDAIAYGGGKFVAVGGNYMAYSNDGETWTSVANSSFGTTDITAVTWGNGKFIAGGGSGKMATSPDGITWTAVDDNTLSSFIRAIAYGGGKFVAVGSNYGMAYSNDGETWTSVAATGFDNIIRAIAYGNGMFVAGGGNGGGMTSSPDGITWTYMSATDTTFGSRDTYAIAYGDGKFVAGSYMKMVYSNTQE